jgi:hypothetical protein
MSRNGNKYGKLCRSSSGSINLMLRFFGKGIGTEREVFFGKGRGNMGFLTKGLHQHQNELAL